MIINLETESELMGKGALKKIAQKIKSSKPVKAIVKSKPVQKLAKSKAGVAVKKFTKTKAGKIVTGALLMPLAPTVATTALATGAAAGTTALTAKTAKISTKIALSPFKAVKKAKDAKAAKAAEKQAIAEQRQAELDAMTPENYNVATGTFNTGIQANQIPVSARTDAGNVQSVQEVYSPEQTEQKKDSTFLKYAIPIGIAAISLLS